MKKRSAKLLKIILSIVVFVWFLRFSLTHGQTFGLEILWGTFFIASLAYLFFTVYGLIFETNKKYVISAIATVILAFIFIFGMANLASKISWLSDELSSVIIIMVALICLANDIRYVKNSFVKPSQENPANESSLHTATSLLTKEEENEEMRKELKSDPHYVLSVSDILEKQLGRKPTYDEIMNYIDNLEMTTDEDIGVL